MNNSKALPLALPAPDVSGFSAVPSVASASAFVGIEGTAQNSNTVDLELAFVGACLGFALLGQMLRIAKKQSCSVCTTATNSHK